MPNQVGSLDAWLQSPFLSCGVGFSALQGSQTRFGGPNRSLPAASNATASVTYLERNRERRECHVISTCASLGEADSLSSAALPSYYLQSGSDRCSVVTQRAASPKRESLLSEQLRGAASVPSASYSLQPSAGEDGIAILDDLCGTSEAAKHGNAAEQLGMDSLQAWDRTEGAHLSFTPAVLASSRQTCQLIHALPRDASPGCGAGIEGRLPDRTSSSLNKQPMLQGSLDADVSACGGGASLACSSSSAGCFSSGSNVLHHSRADREEGSSELPFVPASDDVFPSPGFAATTDETPTTPPFSGAWEQCVEGSPCAQATAANMCLHSQSLGDAVRALAPSTDMTSRCPRPSEPASVITYVVVQTDSSGKGSGSSCSSCSSSISSSKVTVVCSISKHLSGVPTAGAVHASATPGTGAADDGDRLCPAVALAETNVDFPPTAPLRRAADSCMSKCMAGMVDLDGSMAAMEPVPEPTAQAEARAEADAQVSMHGGFRGVPFASLFSTVIVLPAPVAGACTLADRVDVKFTAHGNEAHLGHSVSMGRAELTGGRSGLGLLGLCGGDGAAVATDSKQTAAASYNGALRDSVYARRSFDVSKALSRARSSGAYGGSYSSGGSISGLLDAELPPAMYEGTVRRGLPRKAAALALARARATNQPADSSALASTSTSISVEETKPMEALAPGTIEDASAIR